MTTREAIRRLAQELQEELVVCTTGYACRDLQECRDRAGNFYMIGSMGLAASVGLGLAISRPGASVVVLDGDGSVLMGLGALPVIGERAPKNLIHVVLDNEVFASTGGQRTYSSSVGLDRLALACGYRQVARVSNEKEMIAQWQGMRAQEGPSFLLVKCRVDSGSPAARVLLDPDRITARFMETVNGSP